MPNLSNRPNILFFFPDQLRFDWIGSNPDIAVRTPNLDRLEKNGVTFSKTVCPAPVCAPSRACVAAGTEYDNCPVKGNSDDYPTDRATVYSLLRDSGYHTLGCGKFDLNKGTCTSNLPAWGLDGKHHLKEWGFSDGINNEGKIDGANSGREKPQGPYLQFLEERGLRQMHLNDFSNRKGQRSTFATPLPDDAYCDNWIGQNGLDLIQSVPEGKPWFIQVNFNGPHLPLDITESMAKLYEDVDFPQPNRNDQLTPDEHLKARRNYSAMVENIDRCVGLYLNLLEERGELDNTLIVFSSDHGEMLGDHNSWGKGKPLHPSASVPLVISGPGVQQGITHDMPTTNLDLTATFLDYAGLDIPDDMDSRSLRNLLEGNTSTHRDIVLSGLGNWRMAYDGRYKYIEGFGDTPMFFDLDTDPLENNNIIDAPGTSAHVERLKAELI